MNGLHSKPTSVVFVVAAAVAAALVIAGCESENDSVKGCNELVTYCLDVAGQPSDIADLATCEEVFVCTEKYYYGDCRNRFHEYQECLSDVEGESDCAACADLFLEIIAECPPAWACHPSCILET